MRYRAEKPLHVNPLFFVEPKQEIIFKKVKTFDQSCSVITHTSMLLLCQTLKVLPETLMKIVTLILENFTSLVSFFKLKFAKNRNWPHPVA